MYTDVKLGHLSQKSKGSKIGTNIYKRKVRICRDLLAIIFKVNTQKSECKIDYIRLFD